MTDRRIDSVDLEATLDVANLEINGVDVNERLSDIESALGNGGTDEFTGMTSPLPNNSTVAELANSLVGILNTSKLQIDAALVTLNALIEDPASTFLNNQSTSSTKVWSSAFTKGYVDDRVQNVKSTSTGTDGDRVLVDGSYHSTKKAYSQKIMEEMLTTRMDAEMLKIVDLINDKL